MRRAACRIAGHRCTTTHCALFGATVIKDTGTVYGKNGKFIAKTAPTTDGGAVPAVACP